MEIHPPLDEQIFKLLDEDPTKTYNVESLIETLKSKPQKREVIKTLNSLIKDKKILRIEEDSKVKYRTNAYVPKNVSANSNTKLLFLDMDSYPEILQALEDKCWKKFRVFGFASLSFQGYGARIANSDNLKIIQYPFEKVDTQLVWSLQEVINSYTSSDKIEVCIASKNNFVDACQLVKNRGYHIVVHNDDKYIKKWTSS